MSSLSVQAPSKLGFLYEPHRYKVAYGGRGGGKSWAIADALLIQGIEKPLRIGCFREVQKSIRDSVHKLLGDRIAHHNLGHLYDVQNTVIYGPNGTEILFGGLQDHTVDSIKSLEGLDRAWVEEAQAVSKRSWDILIPTIRKEGSEIWVSMNPELDTDESYRRFVTEPPPDCVSVLINYAENPWFPKILEAERQHAQRTMPAAEYANIWEGKCKPAVTGAIYADEVAAMIEGKRYCSVAYDPSLKVQVVFDLGWNDSMAVILAQKHLSELRIIEYIEDRQRTLDWFSAELKKKNLNWGKLYLPHDGAHGDYKTGKSAAQIMRELGWDVAVLPQQPIETGIRAARMAFPRIWLDQDKGERLLQCLRRYRRGIPSTTGEPGAPVHDEFSHGADAFRYLCVSADRMTNEDWGVTHAPPDLKVA